MNMNEITLKQLLMSSNYFVLNKQITKKLGIETAFLLTVLIEGSDKLSDEAGWFFQTVELIENITGLSKHKQSKIVEKLLSLNLINQKNRGVPCRRYFKINFKNVENLIFLDVIDSEVKKTETISQKINQLEVEKFNNLKLNNFPTNSKKISEHINNIYKENNINNIDYFLFMEKWNELAKECELNIIKSFTENRKKKLSELLEKFTQEEILETMFKIKNINFLLGRTDKSNWKISFDDFLNEEKFIKILEGAYYDEVKPTGRKQDKRIARQKSAGAKKEYGF